MLKRNSVKVHSNTTTARYAKVRTDCPYILGDFGNVCNCLAKSSRVLRSIVLNIEWVHFVLQNCEILHSVVRGLNDKNSASYYCFTSDVMYKWYIRLVYTHPDFLARFCTVNLWNAKNSAAINAIKDDCQFLVVRMRLSTRCKIHS